MSGAAYYNEVDPYAAQWLRNLIRAGHIAPGDVDERSIEVVQPGDLRGYTQCHFFAGIGVWSHALRTAGWPDDRPVWTGSCPCQPFSTAGKRRGHEDERHLWPIWFRLIGESRPHAVFGEQVANGDGAAWLDHVATDLESLAYAFGAVSAPACGFGAPHIRQRLYFVADAGCWRMEQRGRPELADATGTHQGDTQERQRIRPDVGNGEPTGRLADANETGRVRLSTPRLHERLARSSGQESSQASVDWALRHDADRCSSDDEGGVALPNGERGRSGTTGSQDAENVRQPGEVNGFWSDAIWQQCRDGFARPISPEPELFPLVTGYPGRVDQLRAPGNAINAPQATEFIRAYQELTT